MAVASPWWFGPKVKELREQRGWSQAQLAEKVGLSSDGLSRIERSISEPMWGTVIRIILALEVSCEEFMAEPKEHEPVGPGRPPKVKDAPEQPKRPRGRPKKEPESES